MMRGATVLLAAAVVLLASYLSDQALQELRRRAAAHFDATLYVTADSAARLALAALLVSMAWIVFSGPRSRIVGGVLATVGLCVALAPLFVYVIPLPGLVNPFFVLAASGIGGYLHMTGAVLAVLGFVTLLYART